MGWISEARTVDAGDTRAQLRSLNALGYSASYLAHRLDAGTNTVGSLLRGEKERAHRSTAARVAELFDALRDIPARDNAHAVATVPTWSITQALDNAAVRGYEPPGPREPGDWDEWDDDDGTVAERPTAEVVQELLEWGHPEEDVRETYHEIRASERPAVVADLTARGKSAPEIARLLDITERTVTRHRAAARERPDGDHARTRDRTSRAVADARAAAAERDDADTARAYDTAEHATDEAAEMRAGC